MANKGLFLKVPSEGEGKKKGGQKTPFHFFLMEKKQQWEKESKWDNSRSKEQLVKVGPDLEEPCDHPPQAVLPLWEELKQKPPHHMEKYIVLHRQWKADRGNDLEHKYDTMGRSLADIQREGQRQVDLFNNMNRWAVFVRIGILVVFMILFKCKTARSSSRVLLTVTSACREIEETVAVLGHPGVTGASFFVAHFNYLCKYVPTCSRTD